MKTAARWTWKSSISKECVITQLPNKLALKIYGAKFYHLSNVIQNSSIDLTHR